MTKQRFFIVIVAVLMILVALWLSLREHRAPSASVNSEPVKEISGPTPQLPEVSATTKADSASSLWTRPPAKVAARNARRVRFADLKRLGASDEIINRLTNGDFSAVFQELRLRSQLGDASAVNVLERLARFDCGFARNSVQSRATQLPQPLDTHALSTADADWIKAAIVDKDSASQRLLAACQNVDKGEILGWVTSAADQGDGASQMFLSLPGGGLNSRALLQQRLQQSVQSAYPEAEAFLAQGIMDGTSDVPSGASANLVRILLDDAAKSLPYAESELAICEFTGCPGIEPDIPRAVAHAKEAAQRGSFDAMNEIGPKLQASQIDPDEVAAWGLVAAALAQQGCSTNSLSVEHMTSWMSALSSKTTPANAKHLAEEYWQGYGPQMMSNIGCS